MADERAVSICNLLTLSRAPSPGTVHQLLHQRRLLLLIPAALGGKSGR